MPIAHAYQWAAMLAMYNGHHVVFNAWLMSKVRRQQERRIRNGQS